MNSQQRHLIRALIKQYSDTGTESFIAYVAETNGMLVACQALLQSLDAADSTSIDWLQRECSEKNVIFYAFLQEVQQIVALFRPSHQDEDHYATLGISVNVGPEEIKQAYRALSRRYHPDTASSQYRNNPEKFIAINKAYHALMRDDGKGGIVENSTQETQWRRKKVRSVSPEQRKKVFVWALGLLVVLVVVSTVATMSYKKRVMLAGLQQSRGAFIPPPRKMSADLVDRKQRGGIQSIDHPLKSSQATPESSQNVAAKAQAVPEVVPVKERVIELSQTKAEPLATMPSVPAEESRKVPDGNRSDRVGEVKEMAHAAVLPTPRAISMDAKKVTAKNTLAVVPVDGVGKAKGNKRKTSTEPRGSAGFSTEVDGRFSGQQVGVIAVAENNSDTSPLVETEENKTFVEVVAVTDTPGQPNRVVEVSIPSQEKNAGPSLAEVLNSKIPAATANSNDGKTAQEVKLANATVAKVVPPPATSSRSDENQAETDLQTRVDHFFADYINAYEQRNPTLFARFFTAEAEENGKLFKTMFPTYLDLFATTRHISFQVEQRKLRPDDNGLVAVDGQFKVYLEYSDGRKLSGSGPIHFRLTANGDGLLVKEMKYVFNTE